MLNNIEPTLSTFLESLHKKGYKAGFETAAADSIKCIETGKKYVPADMQIVKLHRFEGESDPGDNSIAYAVKCNDGEKGIIIAAYGMYGSAEVNNFMKKVKITDRQNIAGPVLQPIFQ